MIDKIKKNVIAAIIITAVIYLAFSFYADFDSVVKSLIGFNWYAVILVLLLTSVNFFVRFLKWHYYLRLLKIDVSFTNSLLIFLSGLVMSVTPGKFGEVLKSFLLKNISGTPVSESAPIIFVERITDFLSVLLLTIAGAVFFDYGLVTVIITSAAFVALTIIINNRRLSLGIIGYLEKIKFIGKNITKIHSAYEASFKMLRFKPLYEMTFLSILAWLPECFGFYIILTNFNVQVSVFWSIFVYTFSIIIGALTMLPAGIGVTEGSLTYFIFNQTGVMNTAVSATIIIRIATLWFAVIIGIISLSYFKKRNKIVINFD